MPRETNSVAIETSLWELALVIQEVADTEDEAFAVLERMLDQGRISVAGKDRIWINIAGTAHAA